MTANNDVQARFEAALRTPRQGADQPPQSYTDISVPATDGAGRQPEVVQVPEPLCCGQCNVQYTGRYARGNLARHRRIKHGILPPKVYTCEVCQREFKRSDALLKHERKRHRVNVQIARSREVEGSTLDVSSMLNPKADEDPWSTMQPDHLTSDNHPYSASSRDITFDADFAADESASSTTQSGCPSSSKHPHSTPPTSQGTYQHKALAKHQPDTIIEDDSMTTYSVDSSASNELDLEYIERFAEQLRHDLLPVLSEASMRDLDTVYVEELLRPFTWRLYEDAGNPFQRGISVLLHRLRKHIPPKLDGTLMADSSPVHTYASSSSDDTESGEDQSKPFNKDKSQIHAWLDNVLADWNVEQMDNDENTIADDEHLPRLADYQKFLLNSDAYRWLLSAVSVQQSLSKPMVDRGNGIRTMVAECLKKLQPSQKMSIRRSPQTFTGRFKLYWSPRSYLKDQEMRNMPVHSLSKIVCITGSWYEAQCTTITDYVKQTWPSSGDLIIELFDSLLHNSDQDTHVVGQTKNSSRSLTAKVRSDDDCVVLITGGVHFTSEIAEQLAWVVASLQPSSQNENTVLLTPQINEFVVSHPDDFALSCTLVFDVEHQGSRMTGNGYCWSSLFKNVNLVHGYPIRRRTQPNTGLEITLELLSILVGSDQIVRCNGIFMKGFGRLIAVTAVHEDAVIWHLRSNDNSGERIPYFHHDARALNLINRFPSLRTLENTRHVLGWCEDAEELCGSKCANYDISSSNLPLTPASIVIDRLYLEGGMHLIGGLNMRINQKQKPTQLIIEKDFPSLLGWVSSQPVVFFDTSERRVWLVDGASALLHLVRLSIHRDENNEESPYHWVFDSTKLNDTWPHLKGRAAAISTLKNLDNHVMELYVKRVFKKGGIMVKEFATLLERNSSLLRSLEILIDAQVHTVASGEIKTHQTVDRRKYLTGWDIIDVVEPMQAVSTRITYFDTWGDGWMDFVKSIGATVLFGKGFGDLIRPSQTHVTCTQWKSVPIGKNLLCASTSTLKMLHEKRLLRLNTDLKIGHLTSKISWCAENQLFNSCGCLKGTLAVGEAHYDPTQYLETSRKTKRSNHVDIKTLCTDGAIIFRNSRLFGRTERAKLKDTSHGSVNPRSAQRRTGGSSTDTSITAPSSDVLDTSLASSTRTNLTVPDQGSGIKLLELNSVSTASASSKNKKKGRLGNIRAFWRKLR